MRRWRGRSVSIPSLMLALNALLAGLAAFVTNILNLRSCVTITGPARAVQLDGAKACTASFDAAAQVQVAAFVFISLTLIELSITTTRLLAIRRRDLALWHVDDETNRHLHNILFYAREVASNSYGENDRYVRYFLGEIIRLEERLREAADAKELVVPSDEFQRPEDIDGAFKFDSARTFCHTWPITNAGPLFTTTGWTYYFELLVGMVTQGRLDRVRVLLIVSDIEIVDSPRLRNLLSFYGGINGLDAKVVHQDAFMAIAKRNDINEGAVDFGIYDESLLYVTERNSGRFTKDEFRIEMYKRAFESLWNTEGLVLADSRSMKSATRRVSLAELMRSDRAP